MLPIDVLPFFHGQKLHSFMEEVALDDFSFRFSPAFSQFVMGYLLFANLLFIENLSFS
jgi:hypothetical protein